MVIGYWFFNFELYINRYSLARSCVACVSFCISKSKNVEAERKGTLPGCSEACGANSFADASEEADLSRENFYAEAHPFFEARLQRSLVSGSLAFRRCKSADKRGQTKACFQFAERE